MNFITESKTSNQGSRYIGPFLLDRGTIDNELSAGNRRSTEAIAYNHGGYHHKNGQPHWQSRDR
jgi:hypothetical protein